MSKAQEEADDVAGSAPSDHSKEQVAASASPAVEDQNQQELMDGLAVTEDDLLEAREMAAAFSLDQVIKVSDVSYRESRRATNGPPQMMKQVYSQHRRDPNFPLPTLEKIQKFLGTSHVRGTGRIATDTHQKTKTSPSTQTTTTPSSKR